MMMMIIVEGSGRGLNEALSRNLSEGAEENHEKPARIAGDSAGIRTKHLPKRFLSVTAMRTRSIKIF
jgi:hypothetical protein